MAIIISVGIALMILERIFPDQVLPTSPRWWFRVVMINLIQYGVVKFMGSTWDQFFYGVSLLDLDAIDPFAATALAYVVITFIFYWWHRFRHTNIFLWNSLHQIHHSPVRIETATSFYKHPAEILVNSFIISLTVHGILGMSLAVGQYVMIVTAIAEFLYHMNIKTPHWWGYVFQRPEMHRIHHERGRHYSNFADLPVWDMLFGTYKNPKTFTGPCGFKPPRELRFWDMLIMRNVNQPPRGKSS